MPQLRDAQTSELIAEGDPRDLIIIADELGVDRVLWDGVGEVDLCALRTANADAVEHLEGDAAKRERARQDAAAKLAPSVAEVLDSVSDERGTLAPVDVREALEG